MDKKQKYLLSDATFQEIVFGLLPLNYQFYCIHAQRQLSLIPGEFLPPVIPPPPPETSILKQCYACMNIPEAPKVIKTKKDTIQDTVKDRLRTSRVNHKSLVQQKQIGGLMYFAKQPLSRITRHYSPTLFNKSASLTYGDTTIKHALIHTFAAGHKKSLAHWRTCDLLETLEELCVAVYLWRLCRWWPQTQPNDHKRLFSTFSSFEIMISAYSLTKKWFGNVADPVPILSPGTTKNNVSDVYHIYNNTTKMKYSSSFPSTEMNHWLETKKCRPLINKLEPLIFVYVWYPCFPTVCCFPDIVNTILKKCGCYPTIKTLFSQLQTTIVKSHDFLGPSSPCAHPKSTNNKLVTSVPRLLTMLTLLFCLCYCLIKPSVMNDHPLLIVGTLLCFACITVLYYYAKPLKPCGRMVHSLIKIVSSVTETMFTTIKPIDTTLFSTTGSFDAHCGKESEVGWFNNIEFVKPEYYKQRILQTCLYFEETKVYTKICQQHIWPYTRVSEFGSIVLPSTIELVEFLNF